MTQDSFPETPSGSASLEGSASLDGFRAPVAAEQAAARDRLRDALRRARADDAERVSVQAQNRDLELVRLELLQAALAPLFGQIADDELFDLGLMPGVKPRLFLDMIGFVEMGGEGRVYRLVQDRRFGRSVLGESADIDRMVELVTDYVARRMLEREKALASREDPPPLGPATPHPATAAPARAGTASRQPGLLTGAATGFAVVIDLLGAIAFFSLVALTVWLLIEHLGGG